MRWLDAIEFILNESDTALRAEEIARKAIADGLVPADQTEFPADSVRSTISRHIKKTRNEKGFVVADGGREGAYYSLARERHFQ